MTLVTSISELKRELEQAKCDLADALGFGDTEQVAILEADIKVRAEEIAELEADLDSEFEDYVLRPQHKKGSPRAARDQD